MKVGSFESLKVSFLMIKLTLLAISIKDTVFALSVGTHLPISFITQNLQLLATFVQSDLCKDVRF